MVTTISGLQGNTVYRNSSFAPTRGTNSPTGYIQRELQKQGIQTNAGQGNQGLSGGVSTVGNDGQSDTRSGLATNALNSTSTPTGTGTGLNTGTIQTSVGQVPTAQISAIGEINLPYNFKSNQNLISQKQAANQALLDLQKNRQGQIVQYLNDVKDTDDQFNTSSKQISNTAAGRGLMFSSAHGSTASDNYNKFSDMMQRLANNNNMNANDYTTQQNSIIQNLNDQIVAEAANQGYEASQNAGQWNITKNPDPVATPASQVKASYKPKKAKPKPKSKPKKKK